MKLIVKEWSTDILLSKAEVDHFCGVGQGADCCSWLLAGADGFECCCLNKPMTLIDRHNNKQMVALRDGCDFVNNLQICGVYDLGVHELDALSIEGGTNEENN